MNPLTLAAIVGASLVGPPSPTEYTPTPVHGRADEVRSARRWSWAACSAIAADLVATEASLAAGNQELVSLNRDRGTRIAIGTVSCAALHWLVPRSPKAAKSVAIGVTVARSALAVWDTAMAFTGGEE